MLRRNALGSIPRFYSTGGDVRPLMFLNGQRTPSVSHAAVLTARGDTSKHVSNSRSSSASNGLPVYSGVNRITETSLREMKRWPMINPATGVTIGEFYEASRECVDVAVQSARKALKSWRKLTGFERGKVLRKAADIIRDRSETLSRVEVEDTGKPIWEARLDILGCADALEFFGGVAPTVKGDYFTFSGGSYGYTAKEPLGVVAAIGAWNYPFQMACWKSGPALACGNTMVFKPAQWTPQTAVLLAEIYMEAGLPEGVFNVVQGAADTGSHLVSHPNINKASFTGSVQVGSKIMTACAASIKHVTLELGGKSPIIIFDDADVEEAVTGAMLGNWLTQGQVCSNGTRVFVHSSQVESFLLQLKQRTKAMKIGNPMDEDTRVGAMISKEHAEKVMDYISLAKQEGATIAYGGERITLQDEALKGGYYLSPCILTGCHDDMRVVKEEIFGAVLAILPFDTEEEVIRRANNTNFGLAAGVFTRDLKRAHRVVSQLEAGTVYVNNYNIYPVELPFGGYKESGMGRECGELCMQYYCQSKSVYVEANNITKDAPF